MANDEHVALLKQGVGAWNAWRKENTDIRPDLHGANLIGADLGKANLFEANLFEANLRVANLTGADLTKADLGETDLGGGANLSKAHLSGANLFEANLSKANLSKADLAGANLSKADLAGANLSKADLSAATLRRANLSAAILSGANLRAATLSKADLAGAKLREANLRRANLSAATLSGANLREADLREANLRETNLFEATLSKADLAGANLREANLRLADLRDADLRDANLTRANLTGADLTKADLGETDLRGANLVEADFTGADLTGCRIYGISAWGLKLDEETKQRNLVITPEDEPEITVDNIEVAQFIYLMLNNKRVRDVIDTITSKVVLILGRFTDERKAVLDALREELRKRDYLPILFDFEKPRSRDTDETITLVARMARFIVADISDAKSVLQELRAIVPDLPSVPVQPIILRTQAEPGMFDFYRHQPSFLTVHRYTSQKQLLNDLGEKVIRPAELKVRELRG